MEPELADAARRGRLEPSDLHPFQRFLVDRDTVGPKRQFRIASPHHDELVVLGAAIPHRQNDVT